MIVVFTQTYGDNRRELYEIRNKDINLKKFISHFDLNIYSFHNSSKETIEYFVSNNNIKTEIIQFNGISYPNCIKEVINYLKKIGCTKLIFLQDDVFSYDLSEEDILTIVKYLRNCNIPLINMECIESEMKVNGEVVFDENGLQVFKHFTNDYKQNHENAYTFDDVPFMVDFDFIGVVFDKNFMTLPDVWHGELYNNNKFDVINFPRYCTNKKFFKRYNILGRNSWNREQELIELKERKLVNYV
jgi:hypothetical protein